MKGQINIEFLASAMLYLIALGAVVTASSAVLPSYSQETQKADLNLEAKSLTFHLMTQEGRHSFNGGGFNWEYNNTTRAATTDIGLSNGEDFHIDRGKIQALKTVGSDYLNYTQFKEVSDASNQYLLNFTWMPLIQTESRFEKNSPPNSDPDIEEPVNTAYDTVDNDVYYGSTVLRGQSLHFLVTAKNGIYNATYVSNNWNFKTNIVGPISKEESFTLNSLRFKVESFQNRENDRGSTVILSRHLKTFGAKIGDASTVIKFNRYAVLEGEPVKIGVWTW